MRHCYIFILNIFLIFYCCDIGYSQITVLNPSFEDNPSDATVPHGWQACDDRTTPDILPGYWGVYLEPSDGDTYVGIITRENSTYEQFGQRLSGSLSRGSCYEFSIDLAHSGIYAGYKEPIRLQIYLGDDKCSTDQLVYTSELVKNEEWQTHTISFTAKGSHSYIMLRAYIKDGKFSHKGNILIDDLTPLRICNKA